jgi:hypothetical protein
MAQLMKSTKELSETSQTSTSNISDEVYNAAIQAVSKDIQQLTINGVYAAKNYDITKKLETAILFYAKHRELLT